MQEKSHHLHIKIKRIPAKIRKTARIWAFFSGSCMKRTKCKRNTKWILCKNTELQLWGEKLQKSVDSGYFLWYHMYNSFVKKSFSAKYPPFRTKICAGLDYSGFPGIFTGSGVYSSVLIICEAKHLATYYKFGPKGPKII